MPSKPKTARREHSPETIAVILFLHKLNKSYSQIAEHVKIAKSSVTTSFIGTKESQMSHYALQNAQDGLSSWMREREEISSVMWNGLHMKILLLSPPYQKRVVLSVEPLYETT